MIAKYFSPGKLPINLSYFSAKLVPAPTKVALITFALAVFLTVMPSTYAASRTWDGGIGEWSIPTNWSADTVPTSDDSALVFNGGTATISSGITHAASTFTLGRNSGGAGTLSLTGGLLTTQSVYFGANNSTSRGIASVSSGTWVSGSMYVGYAGSGTLSIGGGGLVSASGVTVAEQGGSNGLITISSGTLISSSNLTVGSSAHGSLQITNGGVAISTISSVGISYSMGNSALLSGQGSMWIANNYLNVGQYYDGQPGSNTLTIQDSALVKVGDVEGETINFGTATANFLRLNGGYIALFGDQATWLGVLLTNERIQFWNGTSWATATEEDIAFEYYADDLAGETAAQEATGYSGLGGYTVATSVPEPSTYALIALSCGLVAFARMRRR